MNHLADLSKMYRKFIFYKRFIVPNLVKENKTTHEYSKKLGPVLRLPYRRVFVEFIHNIKSTPACIGLAMQEIMEEGEVSMIEVTCCMKMLGRWAVMPSLSIPSANIEFQLEGKNMSLIQIDEGWHKLSEENKRATADLIGNFTFAFLSKINEKGIVISKARLKTNNPPNAKPYDDYWVLKSVPRDNLNPQDLGGTHARPREHERKGHYRNVPCKEGKRRVFVEATVVNRGVGGMIHKAYKLEETQHNLHPV